MKSYEQALKDRGYAPLVCVGVGRRPDGSWSIKLAADPTIRTFSPETWEVVRTTIIGALDRLIETPLDDLERE